MKKESRCGPSGRLCEAVLSCNVTSMQSDSCRWATVQDNTFALVASSEGWDRRDGNSDVARIWLVCVVLCGCVWVEEDVSQS